MKMQLKPHNTTKHEVASQHCQ